MTNWEEWGAGIGAFVVTLGAGLAGAVRYLRGKSPPSPPAVAEDTPTETRPIIHVQPCPTVLAVASEHRAILDELWGPEVPLHGRAGGELARLSARVDILAGKIDAIDAKLSAFAPVFAAIEAQVPRGGPDAP